MKKTRSNTARRLAIGSLVSCLALGAMGGASFAARGGGGGKPGGATTSSSLSVVMVTDLNTNGSPNWGDTITFSISTTATLEPHVSLTCSQGGEVVYGATAGFYDGYPWPWTKLMTLSSTLWSGGAANCTAKLQQYSGTKVINLASISFNVGA